MYIFFSTYHRLYKPFLLPIPYDSLKWMILPKLHDSGEIDAL